MEKKLIAFLGSLFLCMGMAFAQTQVRGTVISADDGEPMPGVAVKVLGEKTGTVTNADGEFVITVPDATSRLEFTHIGMKPRIIRARNGMRISLDTDESLMQQVLVTGFGTATRASFTGSAKVLNSEDLAKSQVSSVTDALAGVVPGLQLVSSNGAPGATSTIRVRGFSSLNASNDPLIILDGAPYTGDMANLNPSDIESITVTKDAAANALYGARGSNGVIQIVTKRAKAGDAKVIFDAKYGWNTRALQHYQTIESPGQYYEMQYEALKNYYINNGYNATEAWQKANANLFGDSGNGGLGYNVFTVPDAQVLIGQNGRLNPNATLGRLVNVGGEDYWVTPDNWEKVGTRTGIRQEYNVGVQSATDKSSFMMSLGYLDNQGIAYNSDFKRLTGRLKADYQVKSWMKVGGNFGYTRFDANSLRDNGETTNTGNLWAFTDQIAPIYPAYVRNGDGSVKVDGNGIEVMDYGDAMNAGMSRTFITNANPIQQNRLNTNNYEGNAVTGNAFADFTFIKGLTLTVNGAFDLDETRGTEGLNPYYGQFESTGGTLSKYHNRSYDYNTQQLLNYTFNIKDLHNVSLMAGHEFENSYRYTLGGTKHEMFSQKNKELSGAVVDNKSAYSTKGESKREGWFFRALYDYDSRIFASASFRRDGSTRFQINPDDYAWGNFWSAGVAWRLAKERWFTAKWVDELKLKASVGQQGNDGISGYLYTDRFSISNFMGKPATYFVGKGTNDITWETNTAFNLGVEFILWKRLSGEIVWYRRNTTDMLYVVPTPTSIGYPNYYDNIGDMYNTGFEVDLNWNPVHTKNIDWNINLNAATLRNRITTLDASVKTQTYYDLDGNEYQGYRSGNFFITEGKSMYTWFHKEYAGIDHETGEAMWYMRQQKKDDAGNVIKDGNGNPTYEVVTTKTYGDADYFVTDMSTAPKVYGGFGTSLKFYGVDFSINFTYQLGGKQYDTTYAYFMSSPTASSAGQNFHRDLLNAWTPTNKGSDIPRFQYQDLYTTSGSTRFLENASYLNIQNINLGYTLPAAWTRKAQIESLRLYMAAENVGYFSARRGFDPRQSFSSATNATRYSPMRTFSVGAQLTF